MSEQLEAPRVLDLGPGTFHQVALPAEIRLADSYCELGPAVRDLSRAVTLAEMVVADHEPPGCGGSPTPVYEARRYALAHAGQLARDLAADYEALLRASGRCSTTAREGEVSKTAETDSDHALAEAELLRQIRSDEKVGFQLQITRRKSGWTISTTQLDGSSSAVGRGDTFAEAWRRQEPRWAR